MGVYLVNIFLMLFFAFLFFHNYPSAKRKKWYCVIVAAQWIFISGFRDTSVGADTWAYALAFDRVKHLSWRYILQTNFDYLFRDLDVKDPGYMLVEKIFQIFSNNYQMFLLCIAFLFTATMAVWVYKNSKMPCLSFVLYSVLFYSFYAVTGHRQTIATALVVFIGYKFIKERKLFPFLCVSFVAFMIHKSSAVFIIYYLIANIPITKVYAGVMLLASFILAVLGKRIYEPIAITMGFSEDFVKFNYGGAETYAMILCLCCVGFFILYPLIKKQRSDANRLFNIVLLTFASSLLIFQNQGFMRIQQYYSLFMMITIPEMLMVLRKQERTVAYVAIIVVFIAYLVMNQPYYRFCFM